MNDFIYSKLKRQLIRLELDYADPTISDEQKEIVRKKLNDIYKYLNKSDKIA
jgi:Asp-tRNA(Asn)/Glu-tRNA(Gln) amidotransferase C subunit